MEPVTNTEKPTTWLGNLVSAVWGIFSAPPAPIKIQHDTSNLAHISSRDVRMAGRSMQYVQKAGKEYRHDTRQGKYFFKALGGSEEVEVTREEYRTRHRVGAHKIDVGFVTATLNAMPARAMDKTSEEFMIMKDLMNSLDHSFRRKTDKGNRRDMVGERDFVHFVRHGRMPEGFKWTKVHTMKLKQYLNQLRGMEKNTKWLGKRGDWRDQIISNINTLVKLAPSSAGLAVYRMPHAA